MLRLWTTTVNTGSFDEFLIMRCLLFLIGNIMYERWFYAKETFRERFIKLSIVDILNDTVLNLNQFIVYHLQVTFIKQRFKQLKDIYTKGCKSSCLWKSFWIGTQFGDSLSDQIGCLHLGFT